MEAPPKLNESKNPEAYLRLRIKGAMYDYLRSLGFGNKSLRKREREIKAKLEELTNQLGRELTDEEVIKALGYKPDEFYSDLQKISASYLLSLDDLRENLVLQLIFYEEIPTKEVAKLFNVSTARVSQIKESALSKLRKKLKDMV